jgi:7-cyano-7-deazaguanine synthase
MPNKLLRPTTGLLLSGGIDSAVLLERLLERGARVVPFYVRTGCVWDECELAAVRRFLLSTKRDELEKLVVLEMPLADLYGDHWSISGLNVPDHQTPDEAVFLPGRNPLLLIKPALWCQMHGIRRLALATLANNPFDDATPDFFAAFEAMLERATGDHVEIVRPFERMQKRNVMELGRHLPLELTFSCLSPVEGLHCGRCNKCAERRHAFQQISLADRTCYAAGAAQRQPPVHSLHSAK